MAVNGDMDPPQLKGLIEESLRGGCGCGDGLLASFDVNPCSWRDGESPRGAYDPGVSAFVDEEPYNRYGYGISGGHGHEIADMRGYAHTASPNGGSSSGTHTDCSSGWESWDAWFDDDGDSEDAENIQSNGKIINILTRKPGIEFAAKAALSSFHLCGRNNDSAVSCQKISEPSAYDSAVFPPFPKNSDYSSTCYVPEVKINVFRREMRTNIEQATRYLGLLQGTDDNARLTTTTTTTTTIDSPSYDLLRNPRREGARRLVEVFSVRINRLNNNDSEDYCGDLDLYGAIRVEHSKAPFGWSYLYNRQQSDSKCVSLDDDTLSLIGPPRAIVFDGYFSVILDLKDKGGGDLFPGDVSKRSFLLYGHQTHKYKNGRLTSEEVHGEFGSATVYYTIFEYAVQATVKVELVKGDGVYGNIVARYTDYDYSTDEQLKYYRSVLFYKPRSNHANVKLWKVVPLSRSVVAVPTSSSLVIEANLWNYSNDDKIAKGTVFFSPQAKGETVKDIKGDNGVARVTVTWSTMWF